MGVMKSTLIDHNFLCFIIEMRLHVIIKVVAVFEFEVGAFEEGEDEEEEVDGKWLNWKVV